MQRLSTALSTELTDLLLETYWDALVRMPIEAVEWACHNAVAQFIPTYREPFPVPARLREFAQMWQEEKASQQTMQERRQLAQWSQTTDEVGRAAIQHILHMLGESMDVDKRHPVYRQPLPDKPESIEERKMVLFRQVAQILTTPDAESSVREPGEDPMDEED